MTDHNTYRCPHCKRAARECHIMPCLDLEVILQKGITAVAKWFMACGYQVAVKGKNITLSARKGEV